MNAYTKTVETQWGLVQFIYDGSNTGLTQVTINGKEINLPANVKKQTTNTILKKLGNFIKR